MYPNKILENTRATRPCAVGRAPPGHQLHHHRRRRPGSRRSPIAPGPTSYDTKTLITQCQVLHSMFGNLATCIQAGLTPKASPHTVTPHLTRAPRRKVTFTVTNLTSPTKKILKTAPPKLGVDPYEDQTSDSSFGGYSQSLSSFLQEFQGDTPDTSGVFTPSHTSTSTPDDTNSIHQSLPTNILCEDPNLSDNNLPPSANSPTSNEVTNQNVMTNLNQTAALEDTEPHIPPYEAKNNLSCPALLITNSTPTLTFDSGKAYSPIRWDPRQPLYDTSAPVAPKLETFSDSESDQIYVSDDECIEVIKGQLSLITQSENTPVALLNTLSDPLNRISQDYDYNYPSIVPTMRFCARSEIEPGRYVSLRNLQAVDPSIVFLELPENHTLQYSQLHCKVGLFSLIKNP